MEKDGLIGLKIQLSAQDWHLLAQHWFVGSSQINPHNLEEGTCGKEAMIFSDYMLSKRLLRGYEVQEYFSQCITIKIPLAQIWPRLFSVEVFYILIWVVSCIASYCWC